MKPPVLFFIGLFMLGVQPPACGSESTASELNNRAIAEARDGRLEQAVSFLREAFSIAPDDEQIRRNLSFALSDLAMHKAGGEKVSESFDLLQEAVGLYDRNGLAWVRLGDLYYLQRNDFANAIRAWEKAHGLVPEPQWEVVSKRISQAQRDQAVERRFLIESTDHFQVRFPEDAQRLKAQHVGAVLEREYRYLAQELGQIGGQVTVILYRVGQFEKVNAQFDYAIGFYDGRIRIRLEDVQTPWEAAILSHELAHAFLHKLYGSRLPVWIHEGYAQWKEPARPLSEREQEIADKIHRKVLWVPLKWLDAHFEQPSDAADMERAYAQARIVVSYLIEKHGIERFKEFLKRLSIGEAVPDAFEAGFPAEKWSRVEQGILER
ncbi:MAG: hypothetical protein NC910_04485 [Candidatus Omnitrophica bacterium]|nr:hypothetical protein [Candidatus Omnitrophota bacterium]